MTQDIAAILSGWISKDDKQSARIIRSAGGRDLLQYYEAQAVLQMELTGRPDGIQPGGCDTMLDLLQMSASGDNGVPPPTPQQWMELDREFAQYQQRRRAALLIAAGKFIDGPVAEAEPYYRLAETDVRHCLAILDFAASHHPEHRLVSAQPELRPRLVAQLYLASAQAELVTGCVDAAVEQLKTGIGETESALAALSGTDADRDAVLRDLKIMEQAVREKYSLSSTLHEQLDDALAREDYEEAAVLRDRIAGQRRAVLHDPVNPGT